LIPPKFLSFIHLTTLQLKMRFMSIAFVLSSAVLVSASPYDRRFSPEANGEAAKALTEKFKTLTVDSPCTDGDNVCLSNGDFAQCANGMFAAFNPSFNDSPTFQVNLLPLLAPIL